MGNRFTQRRPLQILFTILVTLFIFSGCSTGFISLPQTTNDPRIKAQEYLKQSQQAPETQALAYRLQAADLYIQARDISQAQTILRVTQVTNSTADPALRKSILEARLALLKNDPAKARSLIQTALASLNLGTEQFIPSTTTPTWSNPESTGTGLKIGLLLPSKGPHAEAAKTIRDGFLAAYYKSAQNRSTDPTVKFYDTGEGSLIREAYERALAEQVNIIVGPLTKPEVQVIAKIQPLAIPVLALNTINEDPSIPRRLYQFGLMPEDEVVAVAKHALHHRMDRALILAPQTDWGQRLAATFKNYWKSQGGKIVEIKFYSSSNLTAKVQTLIQSNGNNRRLDADMIFLAATPEVARQVKSFLNTNHADNLPVYATSSVYSGTPSPTKDLALDGIHFCDMPWVIQHSAQVLETYERVAKLWPGSSNRSPRYFALGMDAYPLAVELATTERFPANGFSGFTGALRLNAYRRIQRELVCAKFEHGTPVPD